MFNPYKEVEKRLTEAVEALKAASVEASTIDEKLTHESIVQLQFATACQLSAFKAKYQEEINCPIQILN